MPSKRETFIKTRATESKILHVLLFLAILGSGWVTYDLVKLALLEINMFIP
jgi:hypothetical protein